MPTIPIDVQHILTKEEFYIEEVIERSTRFFIAIGRLSNRKRQYLFKKLLVDETKSFPSFRNEIKTSLALQSGIAYKLTPRVIRWGLNRQVFLIREFTTGKPLGGVRTLAEEYRNPNAKRDYKQFRLYDEQIDRIIKLLKRLRSMKTYDGLVCHTYKSLEKELEPSIKQIKSKISSERLEKLMEIIYRYSKRKDLMKHVCHGDVNLSNFIVYSRHIYVIDWEYTHKGNIGYDFIQLWLSFWQDQSYQQKIAKAYLKSLKPNELEEFKLSLRANLVIHVLKQLSHWYYSKKVYQRDILTKKRKEISYRYTTITSGITYFRQLLKDIEKNRVNVDYLLR